MCLNGGGLDIQASEALGFVYNSAVGLDWARRDLQQRMKDARRPRDIGKGFVGAGRPGRAGLTGRPSRRRRHRA